MPMVEAKKAMNEAIEAFGSYLRLNGYGRSSEGRKRLIKEIGVSEQTFSNLINGNTHGRAAFDRLNKIFNYVGYFGENWIIY